MKHGLHFANIWNLNETNDTLSVFWKTLNLELWIDSRWCTIRVLDSYDNLGKDLMYLNHIGNLGGGNGFDSFNSFCWFNYFSWFNWFNWLRGSNQVQLVITKVYVVLLKSWTIETVRTSIGKIYTRHSLVDAEQIYFFFKEVFNQL